MSEKTTQETIGKLLEGGQQRDAIHIAVYPVVASEKLFPGQEVCLIDGTEKVGVRSMPIPHGIIDPFLSGPVYPDQRCWLFLFPNTVTGMRHEWQHPAFDDAPLRVEAEKWLRELAEEYGLDFCEMVKEASCDDGGHLQFRGVGEVRSFGDKTDAFWVNLQIYTGKHFSPSHFEGLSFSCSC